MITHTFNYLTTDSPGTRRNQEDKKDLAKNKKKKDCGGIKWENINKKVNIKYTTDTFFGLLSILKKRK